MNEKAPERIYMHPTSAEANVNPWPLEPGEYVEYVRADLLATARKEGFNDAVGVARSVILPPSLREARTQIVATLERAAATDTKENDDAPVSM